MADNILINQGTQTTMATDDVSSVHYPRMKLDMGGDGVANPFTGTIGAVTNLAGGTITKLEGGTVAEVTLVKTAGTISAGDNNIGNVDIVSGTQQTLGTVGVVNNLVTGTLASLASGTITAGTVAATVGAVVGPNASAGTSTTAPVQIGGTTATGTVYGMLVDTAGNPQVDVVTIPQVSVGTLSNIPGGTITLVTTVSNLTNGSVILQSGTLTNGTITPYKNPSGSVTLTTHTLGTAAGTTWGTLIAPVGAGTYVYVQGISIVARSGTPDCAITTNVAGSTGAGVLARGAFVPSGGIARDFNSPIQVGTNGTIAYMILNGTADLTVNYWVGT